MKYFSYPLAASHVLPMSATASLLMLLKFYITDGIRSQFVIQDVILTSATKPIYWVAIVIVGLLVLLLLELETIHPTTKNIGADLSIPPLPFLFKMIDILLDTLPFSTWDVKDPAKLLKKGAHDAGLPERYSHDVLEAIHMLCESIKEDKVKLHWVGRKNLHHLIVSGLSHYLQVHEAHRLKPELSSQVLKNPLVIVGLPRSGTTHAHRLLELSPDSISLPMWEHFYPVPPKRGFDLRSLRVRVEFFFWKGIANRYGLDSVHYVRPDLPDECTFSLRLAGQSHLFWSLAPVYSYLEWLSRSDQEESYKTYRLVLQLIQARNPNKRIVLKCPSHAFAIQTLTKVIPEAHIIMTHRDPKLLLNSEASLITRLQAVSSKETVDWKKSMKANASKTFLYCQRMAEFASQSPAPKVYHSRYSDLVNKPVALMRDIHKFFGIEMTESYEDHLSNYLSQNRQHSHGKHNYTSQSPVLTDDEINEGLKDYLAVFDEYLQ